MKAYCWFDYKTVIVSGASSGIGKGLTERLIKDHCCNVIGIGRSKKKMEAFVEELGAKSCYFSYYLFDVSVEENWKNFAEELRKDGVKPDILINNAGILPKFNRFSNYTMEEIKAAIDINFYSCVYSIHYVMPIILESDTPGLINISSSAARYCSGVFAL